MAESSKEALYLIIIGIITSVVSTFITDFIKNNFFNNRTMIIGLCLILVFLSLILLISPTDTFRNRQRQLYQQILTRYRNYIRLTGIIVFIISTTFFVQYIVDYNSSQTIPDLQIRLINNGSNEIHVSNRGEFYLTALRTPGSDQLTASGKIKLKMSDNKYPEKFIIPPKGESVVYAQIINPVDYLALFQRGDIDMRLIINADGKMITIPGVPFDRETFLTYYIPCEIENKEAIVKCNFLPVNKRN